MAFDPDFLSMMHSVATHAAVTSTSGYGKTTFGAPVSFVCHVTYATKAIRGDTDERVTSTAQIQLPPPGYVVSINGIPTVTPTMAVTDNIVLPDGEERFVLDVTSHLDETGQVHHQSVSMT